LKDLHRKCVGFKICLAVFAVSTVGRGYVDEQLACSTADCSGKCVGVQG